MSEIREEGTHSFTNIDKYEYPDNEYIQKKIEWFKDQKLGFMSHFGLYNHYGIVESWALSDELDNKKYRWSQRQITWTNEYSEFRKNYFDSYKTFNPDCFNPSTWADIIKKIGFKYAIITTKHHDGFCLWDTKTTEFKSTSELCHYSINKFSNIIPCLYSELKKRDIGIGVYFSKADWSRDNYWERNSKYGSGRNVNYDTSEKAEKWQDFVDFSHTQIKELTLGSTPVDILWLDGGWVKKENKQDFQLDRLVPILREHNEDLLVCDRTVGGIYENYITPEQEIPSKKTNVPWESCITMAEKFSYEYDANYKSSDELVELFVNILIKGGNLVINVSPQPNGLLPQKAIKILNSFSRWVEKNKMAIFNTRPVVDLDLPVVQNKDETKYYYFNNNKSEVLYNEYMYIEYIECKSIRIVEDDEEVNFEKFGNLIKIKVPDHMVGTTIDKYTAFEIERI